jgi:hypothetical protein
MLINGFKKLERFGIITPVFAYFSRKRVIGALFIGLA